MGKTIKALKRNRKKYQEAGEVALSPAEMLLWQQAGNEVNQMLVEDYSDDPKYGNIAKEAQKVLNEQNLAPQPVTTEPALLEQTEEALAGSPAESQTAPTSLLETTAAPAPAAPVYDPAKDGDLRMWSVGQQLNVTPAMVKSSVDYTSSLSGGNNIPAIQAAKDKLKQEFPEAYAQAFPDAAPAPAPFLMDILCGQCPLSMYQVSIPMRELYLCWYFHR